ncbi:MAG: sarcosine oxidase subunit gamma [Actinomycetota bacterium]
MADGRARSPLAGRGDLDALGAREAPLLAQVSLRLAEPAGSISLPEAPNTWIAAGERELLWLGPDEWLVVGALGTAGEIAAWLDGSLADRHRSVVDVSSNRTAIELAGKRRRDLLEQGCGLDLHPRAWGLGMCAQTLLARIPVLLQEREEATRVFVRPSFVASLADWLIAVGEA